MAEERKVLFELSSKVFDQYNLNAERHIGIRKVLDVHICKKDIRFPKALIQRTTIFVKM